MPRKYAIKGPVSELQWKIIRHICTTKDADYKSISDYTNRKRTTIIQSIGSLMKHSYIEKVKVDPIRKNSKLIFRPTYKAKMYVWNIGYAWEEKPPRIVEIFHTEKDPFILSYIEILNQISEPSQLKAMSYEFASNLLNLSIIDRKGNIKINDRISSVKDAFREGLLTLIKNREYDAKNLFNDNTIKWLTNFFSQAEIIELKDMLLMIRVNLNSSIQILSNLCI
jgi:hypothetical protein